MSDFEKLHDDYIESFKHYRKMIQETNAPLDVDNEIFEQIYQDMIFSEDARSKIYELNFMYDDEKIGALINSLLYYLDSAILEKYGREIMPTNIIRYGMRNKLGWIAAEDIPNEKKRKHMLKAIDKVVLHVQNRHKNVISEFLQLKRELLQ